MNSLNKVEDYDRVASKLSVTLIDLGAANQRIAELEEKLAAAEALIKDSQEQEAFAYHNRRNNDLLWPRHCLVGLDFLTPLFTSPPIRHVLTDEEIYAISSYHGHIANWGMMDVKLFARAIEKKVRG